MACASPRSPEEAPPVSAVSRADALIADYAATAVSSPPDSLGLEAGFYKKHTDAGGIPVVSSEKVPDAALLVARDIVIHMLLKRPDLREFLVADGQRVGVMAVEEKTTDIPEQRDWKKPAFDDPRLTDGERARYYEPGGIAGMTDKEYWDRRARGMGGRYTTCAEENVLGYPGTRYYGEHILVHEFSHAIHRAIRAVDPELAAEIQSAYEDAMASGRFERHYAANTVAEYWAEGTQWWFWSNYQACFGEASLWSPEDLGAYDPTLFELLGRVYPDHHIPVDVYHGTNLRPRECGGSPG
ncbi:MAG: glycoside hydrolase [Longimicrobiales bacterium]